jgi:hypothetical protein
MSKTGNKKQNKVLEVYQNRIRAEPITRYPFRIGNKRFNVEATNLKQAINKAVSLHPNKFINISRAMKVEQHVASIKDGEKVLVTKLGQVVACSLLEKGEVVTPLTKEQMDYMTAREQGIKLSKKKNKPVHINVDSKGEAHVEMEPNKSGEVLVTITKGVVGKPTSLPVSQSSKVEAAVKTSTKTQNKTKTKMATTAKKSAKKVAKKTTAAPAKKETVATKAPATTKSEFPDNVIGKATTLKFTKEEWAKIEKKVEGSSVQALARQAILSFIK